MSRLYPNCIPVEGYTNIAFCDLERQCFHVYPKSKFQNPAIPKDEKLDMNRFVTEQATDEAIAFLKERKLIMTDETIAGNVHIKAPTFYKWKSPSLITNAIIELSDENKLLNVTKFINVLTCLDAMLCKHLFLVIKRPVTLRRLELLIACIHKANVQSVKLAMPYRQIFYTDEFGELIMKHEKIQFVILESSPFEKNIENKIYFITKKLNTYNLKKQKQFVSNIPLFSESQLHHTYFNRKLFIGSSGEIKNAPECAIAVGNVHEISDPEHLISLIKTKDFQKYWYVFKESCEVCKDCEFRHVCVDNRVPHQREDGHWYHQQECNYDPYTGKWKDEQKIVEQGAV
jgi:SPASM domain peptide maturase of grasp-with-spasm system